VEVPESPTSEAVTLVAYSDREGADANRRWAQVLVERYRDHLEGRAEPNLRVVAVAHLRGVPFFVRAFVKRGFRGREPDGSPILPIALDWKGTVAAQLGFTPGVPNLAVIDPEGAVAARSAARADDEEAAEILSVLDALLASGAQTGVGG
ncbi:MAG: hypothetical protein R3190_00890, partial [Thermoanaerobaculia bacterium]|nr:hypothetical protein [Thermoanaerobaculia bacterium]